MPTDLHGRYAKLRPPCTMATVHGVQLSFMIGTITIEDATPDDSDKAVDGRDGKHQSFRKLIGWLMRTIVFISNSELEAQFMILACYLVHHHPQREVDPQPHSHSVRLLELLKIAERTFNRNWGIRFAEKRFESDNLVYSRSLKID
ncbi:5708_t:CDS:2 [Acaulospora morrowiae]|uniref:5708_t:CDS:1 n=1 Tax=Acaulospora morrowiae TaxID=94023 RepID=A0A9N9EAQ9_9GLOM|nr:5708_t:CDS:2 [Acaulospora morrowiae]